LAIHLFVQLAGVPFEGSDARLARNERLRPKIRTLHTHHAATGGGNESLENFDKAGLGNGLMPFPLPIFEERS